MEARQKAHSIVARCRIPLARSCFARDNDRPVFLARGAPGRSGVHLFGRTCPVVPCTSLSSLIVLSFIGVCCLSYFFALPIYSFRVDYAQDLITISAFVITSFVVNFLVTRVRDANQKLEVTNEALRIENVERKRAEQAQRESEDKLRQIIETGPSLLWS